METAERRLSKTTQFANHPYVVAAFALQELPLIFCIIVRYHTHLDESKQTSRTRRLTRAVR